MQLQHGRAYSALLLQAAQRPPVKLTVNTISYSCLKHCAAIHGAAFALCPSKNRRIFRSRKPWQRRVGLKFQSPLMRSKRRQLGPNELNQIHPHSWPSSSDHSGEQPGSACLRLLRLFERRAAAGWFLPRFLAYVFLSAFTPTAECFTNFVEKDRYQVQ